MTTALPPTAKSKENGDRDAENPLEKAVSVSTVAELPPGPSTSNEGAKQANILDDLNEVHVPSEFGMSSRPCHTRRFHAVQRDLLNIYVAFRTLMQHMASFETGLSFALAIWSALFYTIYAPDGHPVAARLDFAIIGTAVALPIRYAVQLCNVFAARLGRWLTTSRRARMRLDSFIISETFRRRENALSELAHMKAMMCQVFSGMMLWRWEVKEEDAPRPRWKHNVKFTLKEIMRATVAILRLPQYGSNRHMYTEGGRKFRRDVLSRQRELTHVVLSSMVTLQANVEYLKKCGLSATEASRLNQYVSMLQVDFERLVMIKSYRTTNAARSFVRINLIICPAFYGPFFAYVARGDPAGPWTVLSLTYVVLLAALMTFVLQGLVKVQRALEDPFVSPYVGEAILLTEEEEDTARRLDSVLQTAEADLPLGYV